MRELIVAVQAILLLSAVWLAGIGFGYYISDRSYGEELVKRGHAEYSRTTGKWQWKTEAEQQQQGE
jgi:hypothetical protein